MKSKIFPAPQKFIVRTLLLVPVFLFSIGVGSGSVVSAGASLNQGVCGQLLADAEAQFRSTLAADGSIPASPETKAAAQEYIRVSKLCYEEMEAQSAIATLQGEDPAFIDEGGLLLEDQTSPRFVFPGNKWGTSPAGSSGGTVTYSFMGNGVSFAAENAGNSVGLGSLPGFQACFVTEIQNAFAAWQAVANIQFVQVNDNGAGFNASNASGDIRIGAHHFDGPSGTLAHAYYPPPNGNSAAGDMHFDSSEYWTCNTSGMDIGIVALHEIGHAVGLAHENTSTITVMDPYYNTSLASLQADDINGASSIYGRPAPLAAAPPNDESGSATVIGIPFSETLDTTAATPNNLQSPPQINCGGNVINQGTMNVWYRFSPATTMNVSFDTFGSTAPAAPGGIYDTYIALRNNSLGLIACNDDTASSLQSQLVVRLTPGTYYIEVAQYNGNSAGNEILGTGGSLKFRALATGGPDTTGVFRPSNGVIFLKNFNASGFADIAINYGIGGDYPVTGDWDGNGTDTIGVYRNGTFFLRNSNTLGIADLQFPFGAPGDQPIAGDWDGDGDDTIGLYRPSTGQFLLRNSNSSGSPQISFFLGNPGDVGIAGDWNGDGTATTGVFRPGNGKIFLKNFNSTGVADVELNYGIPGDKPVVGDWDDNGTVTIGVYRNGRFLLRNSNTPGFAEIQFNLGNPSDMPIAGNWDGIP